MADKTAEKDKDKTPRKRSTGKVWLAYDADRKALTVDGSEIKVMRAAVRDGRRVAPWPFGEDMEAAIAAAENADA